MRTNTRQYDAIEALRFVAAMAVVFVHIPTIGIGHFGVDIFFVISGFVIMLSTEQNTNRFFVKRLIRIVPTYYVFTLGIFVIALVYPELLNKTTADFTHLLKSLLFIPFDKNGIGHQPILFLGWTLNYELYFYAVFAVCLTVSKTYRGLLCTLMLLVGFLLCQSATELPLKAYGSLLVFEFALGVFLYLVMVKQDWPQSLAVVAVIVVAVVASDATYTHRFMSYGLPSALVVAGVLLKFKDTKLPNFLLTLGGASYALYLTHPYIIRLFNKLTGWFDGGPLQASLALVISVVLANVMAVAVYRLVEMPSRHYLRKRLLNN